MRDRAMQAAAAAVLVFGMIAAAPLALADEPATKAAPPADPAPEIPAPPPAVKSGTGPSFSFAVWYPKFDLEAKSAQQVTIQDNAGADVVFPISSLGMHSIGEGLTIAETSREFDIEEQGHLSSRLLVEAELFGRPLFVDYPSKLISYGVSANGAAFSSPTTDVLSSLEIQFFRIGYSVYQFEGLWGTIYAGISSQRYEVTVLDTNSFSRVGHVVHSSFAPGVGWFIGGVDSDPWFQYFRIGLWTAIGRNTAVRFFFHFRWKAHVLGAEAEVLFGFVSESLAQGRRINGIPEAQISVAGAEIKIQVALAAAGTGPEHAHPQNTAVSPQGSITAPVP